MVIIIRLRTRRLMMMEVVLVSEDETKLSKQQQMRFSPTSFWVPAQPTRPIVKRLYSKFPPRTPWHHTAMLCHLLPVAAAEILYIHVCPMF